jgi:hypothetical protein
MSEGIWAVTNPGLSGRGLCFVFFLLPPSSSFSFFLLKISMENLEGLPWDPG